MAISGNSSYIPTTQEFIAHWTAANAALGGLGPVTLPGSPLNWPLDVTVDTLEGFHGSLQSVTTGIQAKVNAVELTRGALVALLNEALGYVVKFNAKVRGSLGGTRWVGALPAAPTIGDSQSGFCDALDDVLDIWGRINAEEALGVGAVLKLVNNAEDPPVPYVVANFQTLVFAVRDKWRGLGTAEVTLKLARGTRDELQNKIYPVLKAYRQVLPTFFKADSAYVASLPRLTPVPGSTPEAAVLGGAWNAGTAKADLSAAVPVQTGLKALRLMYSPGTTWSEEDASVVESRSLAGVDLSQPVLFATAFALANAGDRALFRVLVVNETDNEASSNVVEVVRA